MMPLEINGARSGELPPGKRSAPAARACRRLVLGVWVVLLLVIGVRSLLQPARNTVYPIFANAARAWATQANLYDEQTLPHGRDQYRYAPAVAVAFVPFSLLPDGVGGLLWRLVNMAVFLGGFAWFCRDVWPGQDALTAGGVACLGAVLLPLSLGSLNNGQANPLVIGLLLLALVAVTRERWNWAALFLTVPVLFKLYPLAVALLVLLLYPRQLGGRLALFLAVGLLLPFLFQEPHYVAEQYRQWFAYLGQEDRRTRPITDSYRDFYLLARWVGYPLPSTAYLLLQLAVAGTIAGTVAWGAWPRALLLRRLLDLGCCWMVLFGPATENCTYILLAPTLALAVWEGVCQPRPLWTRGGLAVIVGIFVTAVVLIALPGGRALAFGLNPLAALLLFGERLANSCSGNGVPDGGRAVAG